MTLRSVFLSLTRVDAHHRLALALGVAAIVWLALAGRVPVMTHVFAAWDSFSLVMLVLAWVTIFSAHPLQVRQTAQLQDSSRTGIFIFIVVSACASLLALAFLLGTARGLERATLERHVVVSLFTVMLAWLLVHTTFVLRYAHLYYGPGGNGAVAHSGAGEHAGGLQFPGGKSPDYLDFAYFSFVIGMTCQVSDVAISSREIRRLALAHGLVSFAFNTAILAFSFNVASSLL